MIVGRFISCLTSTSSGQIIVGLSDGSIHTELALKEGIAKSSNKEDTAESIDSTYWTVVGAHKTDDGCIDPIADIVLSPNETHLVYIFSSSKIGIARITNDDIHESYGKRVTTNTHKIDVLTCFTHFSERIDREITAMFIKYS